MKKYLDFLKKQIKTKNSHLELLTLLFSIIVGAHILFLDPLEKFEHYKILINLGFSSDKIGLIILGSALLLIIKWFYLNYKIKNNIISLFIKLPSFIIFTSCWFLTIIYSRIPLASELFLLLMLLSLDSIVSE